MTVAIFLVLHGVGIVFLLYVLANFWKEGHRTGNNARRCAAEFGRRDWADVYVVTHSSSPSKQGRLSVIPFRARGRYSNKTVQEVTPGGTLEASVRLISTR
jgi:hypothetical protein